MKYEKYKEQAINDIMKRIYEVVKEEVEATIDDLKCEIEAKEEELEDYKRYVESNYKPLQRSDYTGDSYDDRY